jgi:hypothetical protein
VHLSSRSDEELVTLARRGWPAPFAVLLHRHGATVRAAVAGRSDPDADVVRTFSRAMQQLRRVDPATEVEPWLLALVPGRRGRTAPPAASPPLDGPQVDALWAQLGPRWPNGRAPRRRLPTWLRWASLTVVLMALAVLIPYVTITTGQAANVPDTGAEPLRAGLLESDDAPDDETAEVTDGEGDRRRGDRRRGDRRRGDRRRGGGRGCGTPSDDTGTPSDDTGPAEGADVPRDGAAGTSTEPATGEDGP